MSAIEIHELEKSYGTTRAVRGISLAIEAGEVFCLLGPNGAGKTTTVEIVEGHRLPTSGRVSVLGRDPGRGERELRDRIGVVLQEPSISQDLTVGELLEMHARWYSRSLPVDDVIELVELEASRDTRAGTLSGGQRRRLDLALALIGDPDVLFLDEPTTGFDPHARRQAWSTIRSLCDLGKTVVLTTHYMDEAQNLADRVAVMVAGEIVAIGPPESLGRPRRAADRDPLRTPRGRDARRPAATARLVGRGGRRGGARHDPRGSGGDPHPQRLGARARSAARGPVADPAHPGGRLPGPHGRRARGGPAMTTTAFPIRRDLALTAWQVRYAQRAFWRNRRGAVLSIAFPLMFLIVFGSLNHGHLDTRGNLSFIDFYVPGIIAYAIILTCFNTTALGFAGLRANGVLKRLRVTPLPWWVFVAGTVGSTLLVATLSIVVMLAVGIVAFGATPVHGHAARAS